MYSPYRLRLACGAAALSVAVVTATVSAQTPAGMITSFEPPGPTELTYTTGYPVSGQIFLQDNWSGGDRFPRVQTAEEIANELTLGGLNVGQTTVTGNQALVVSKVDTNTEGSGYLVRNTFTGLESENKVTAQWWARPLTSAIGADPSGSPAGNNKTIGERQGNTFIGIMDSAENRAIAVRFGVDTVGSNPYENVTERHIDWASFSTGNLSAPWVKTGLLWEADQWYKFRFDMDFTAKTFDFYVNDMKVNDDPVQFYNPAATNAAKFFISRGTNQAGQIIDDVNIQATANFPPVPVLNADFDNDGDVDGRDLLVWQSNLGTATGAELADGDANEDGAVTDADLAIWKVQFSAGGGAVSAIPEPASAVIASCMLVGLVAVGRRARRA